MWSTKLTIEFIWVYNQDLVKVITGIRRCDKSVILTQIMDELKQTGIIHKNIIDFLLNK